MEQTNELTDGKLYSINDMVKLECNDCAGCFSCCQDMGSSVILNPYDLWQLEQNLGQTFAELMQEKLELNVTDGMILPNLKMTGEKRTCTFLNQEKRCSIHAFRPGICRLFPLGRQYGENSIQYIFLKDGCKKENRTKIKIKKWLDIPERGRNDRFLLQWHQLQKQVQQLVLQSREEEMIKELNLYLLDLFFVKPYETKDFYEEFDTRLSMAQKLLEKL